MEIELVAFGDDAPSGENLEYDDVFTALELAAKPGEDSQFDEDAGNAEPDHKDIAKKARAVLEQSHDLRAAVHLANAELRLSGFEGFAAASGYIRDALRDYWDSCHPQLDEDDGDPTMRVNAVLGLAEATSVLRGLRNAPLSMSQAFGCVTLRMLDVQSGEVTARDDETVLDTNAIAAAFKDTDPDTLQGIFDHVSGALANVTEINAIFDDKIPGEGPDLTPALKALKAAEALVGAEVGADVEAPAEMAVEAASEGAAPKKSSPPGEISSQSDVAHSLKKIIDYYQRNEPSSPLPILLERALRLVGADFMTIIKDVAPDGIHNAHLVGGTSDEED